jgi:hypothetical protein
MTAADYLVVVLVADQAPLLIINCSLPAVIATIGRNKENRNCYLKSMFTGSCIV